VTEIQKSNVPDIFCLMEKNTLALSMSVKISTYFECFPIVEMTEKQQFLSVRNLRKNVKILFFRLDFE
jgi:hypothetical protein